MEPRRAGHIGVCGAAADGLSRVHELLETCGAWPTVSFAPRELPKADELATFALFVLATTADAPSAELIGALRARPDATPLIVIGANPARLARPDVWWSSAPSAELLGTTLATMLDAPARSTTSRASWRRKADMIIGNSRQVRDLLRSLDQLTPAQTPVLITGESGVGKELVARALHFCSPRASAPFVAINCGAIPETLFEAELFGYQKGAFTGAVATHIGAFEAADNGTLFLDEIGDLPMAMQVKLLRVLQTCEVQRVGSMEVRQINLRLVTATNRNLQEEVDAGRFREDLFYRIHVYPLHIPPLRERPEDIAPIVQHQLSLIATRDKRPALHLSSAALEKLITYAWPGNVRQLINLLERAALLAGTDKIEAEHIVLSDAVPGTSVQHGSLLSYREAKQRFELDYYTQLMRAADGNVSLAAKLGQKTRKEIYDALKRLGLDATTFRSGELHG